VKKYQVRFYIDFEIEAKNKDEALEEADEMLANAFEQCHFGYIELFESEVKPV